MPLSTILGKPSSVYDSTNPDWLPSARMGYVASSTPSRERFVRLKRRSSTHNSFGGNQRRLVVDTPIDDDDKDDSLETDHDLPMDTFLAQDVTETDAVLLCLSKKG